MSDDSDFCDDDMYSYDDGEFFAEACSRADALAALGYNQEDFDNDEENLLGYEVYTISDPWVKHVKILLQKLICYRDEAKIAFEDAKSGSHAKAKAKKCWEEVHSLFEKLNTALDMDDQFFNLNETELYLRDKETPVSPEPRQNISKEINTPNEGQIASGESVLEGRSAIFICKPNPEDQNLLQGNVSKNKKKKLLRKTTETCLAVTSHSNSGADILDVADRLERTKLEDGV